MTKLHVPKPPPAIDTGGSDIHYRDGSNHKLPKNKDRPYFILFAFIFGVVVGLNIGVITMGFAYGSR